MTMEAEARGMRAPGTVAYKQGPRERPGSLSPGVFGGNSVNTLVWISSPLLCGPNLLHQPCLR